MAVNTGPSKSFASRLGNMAPGLTNSLAQGFGDKSMSQGVKAAGSAFSTINKNKNKKQMQKSTASRMQPYPSAPMQNRSSGNMGPSMGAGMMGPSSGMPTGASSGARPYAYNPMLNNTMPISAPVPLGQLGNMNLMGGGMGMGDSMTGDAMSLAPSFSQPSIMGGPMNPSMGGGGLWEKYRNLTTPQMQQPQGQLFY